MEQARLDQLLEDLDVRIDAFAICEIGRHHSLRCSPCEEVVVHFVLQGEGFLECEHGRFALQGGTIILVPRRFPKLLTGTGPIEQIVNADQACPLSDGIVSFRALSETADLVLGCAVLSAGVSGTFAIFDHIREPVFEQSGDPILHALFAAMLHELRAPGIGTRGFVSALMKQIIILLARPSKERPARVLLAFDGLQLAGAVAAVLRNPQHTHTIETMSNAAGMSRSRFHHHFATTYSCTPRAFVQSMRLASAAKMLTSSELPVKSIAASVGYASRSHFSRAFNAKYGVDPSAYRRIQGAE